MERIKWVMIQKAVAIVQQVKMKKMQCILLNKMERTQLLLSILMWSVDKIVVPCYLKENNAGGCSIAVKPENYQVPPMVPPMVRPMQFPINGYGSFHQGFAIDPNLSGGLNFSQNTGFPFYLGGWNPFGNGTSMNNLLQQVMKNGGQGSGKEQQN
ncbi:hypothetical protein SESBI_24333 [Sesbania bispinosa]|nr:hypothetical protein SESBI_24333 [Sesbania bispinosa]